MARILPDKTAAARRIERDASALLAALDDLARQHPQGVGTPEVMAALEMDGYRARRTMMSLVLDGRCAFTHHDGSLTAIYPRGGMPPMRAYDLRALAILREEIAAGRAGAALREAVAERLQISPITVDVITTRAALLGAVTRIETAAGFSWRFCDEVA